MEENTFRCLWNGKRCRKIGEPNPIIGQKYVYVHNGHYFYSPEGKESQVVTEKEWLKLNKK